MASTNPTEESLASMKDTFQILVATDIHLGYAENDPERREDSFNTFEEILQLAKAHEVDFILLGGDLFHENKPSAYCLHKCLSLFRQYCLGDKPIEIEFLSDQSVNFQHCDQTVVNYDDPNLNVSIPVFSIHGNHDDPNGYKQLSSLDILSTSGLVNYFGKWTDLREVKIIPILLRKGQTKLALYGLSHIKDERLSRLFRDKNVHMFTPSEHANEWFSLFVCHQNRAERGLVKYVPENALPDFLDLVIWGHEHECRIVEEWNQTQGFYVTQPGSSIATSLSEGEAKEKFVGLLQICKKKFKLTPIRLQTVRPFIFQSLKLSECTLPVMDSKSNSVQKYLEDRLEFWLEEAKLQLTGHEMQPKLPLVRIRVAYDDEGECFNSIRFGQKFQSKVANPGDMILLKKDKPERKMKNGFEEEKANMEEFLQNEELTDMWEVKMNLLMQKYFDEEATRKLKIFSVKGISDAAARFIDKSDKESIKAIIEHQMNKIEKHLCEKKVDVDHIDEEIESYRQEYSATTEAADLKNIIQNKPPPPPKTEGRSSQISDSDHSEEDATDTVSINRGRGRGSRGNRGSRAVATTRATTSRARGRARGSQNTTRATSASSRSSRSSIQTTLLSHVKYDSDSD